MQKTQEDLRQQYEKYVQKTQEDLRLQYVEEGRVEGTAEGREGESSREETPI